MTILNSSNVTVRGATWTIYQGFALGHATSAIEDSSVTFIIGP